MSAGKSKVAPILKSAMALGIVLLASGCSSSVIDSIPTWAGGEPVGTPERPAMEMEYPPVNDRPASRETKVVTEQEQARIERELAAIRDAQARQAAQVKKDRDGMLANAPRSSAGQPADDKATQTKTAPKNPPGN
jgi:hypothetical protein